MQEISPTVDNITLPQQEFRIIYKPKKNQTIACNFCKSKKIKCSGNLPCSNCTKKGFICEYVEQKRRGKKKKAFQLGM